MSELRWKKSSYSQGGRPDCVEVADGLPGVIAIRDSKDPHGDVHAVGRSAFRTFVAAVKRDGLYR